MSIAARPNGKNLKFESVKLASEANRQWVKELLNPETVRTKFVMMGLFMVAHELLEDSIKRPLLSFFADEWKDRNPIQSEEYRDEVLKLDPKGKEDARRGSIEWLKRMSVIDDSDELSIREVTDVRNTLAHEMRYIVGGMNKMPDLEKWFPRILDLVTKIERWWFLSVDLDILGNLHNLDEINKDEIITGPMAIMQVLCQVALGDHDEAWALHHIFSGLGRE